MRVAEIFWALQAAGCVGASCKRCLLRQIPYLMTQRHPSRRQKMLWASCRRRRPRFQGPRSSVYQQACGSRLRTQMWHIESFAQIICVPHSWLGMNWYNSLIDVDASCVPCPAWTVLIQPGFPGSGTSAHVSGSNGDPIYVQACLLQARTNHWQHTNRPAG